MGYGIGACIEDDTRLAAILETNQLDHIRLRKGNHWVVGSKENFAKASALQVAFAYELQQLLGVPVGILGGSNSGSKASGWVTAEMLLTDEELIAAVDGKANLEAAMKKPKDKIASNYDDRIKPLEGFPIRAMLWDQGEAGTGMKNVPFPETTRALFRGWRQAWGQVTFQCCTCRKTAAAALPSTQATNSPAAQRPTTPRAPMLSKLPPRTEKYYANAAAKTKKNLNAPGIQQSPA